MARALQGGAGYSATMGTVAGWDNYSFSAPDTPNSFDVSSAQCYGWNSVSWDSESHVEQYQLLRSFNSSFSPYDLIYSGTGTSTNVNVPYGNTWYLRVRACNGSGCSDTSIQDSATYYNGCL